MNTMQSATTIDWCGTDVLWEDLSYNHKIGPRLFLKRKAARYIAKKKKIHRLTHTMVKRIIAKAKKIRRSYEKRERFRSKQLLKQTNYYLYHQ